MRVTQFTFYNDFLINQQATQSELVNVQRQIATGKKIQNLDEDPVIYNEYLKLDEELNSFTQIKNSANFALNFARETDTTINDIVDTLNKFKTKLLQAANDTNNETSRNAIVEDLKGMLEHLKDLANTSIDGKFIFSGSAFNTKPIDDDYKYQGNSEYVKAFLGASIEREYNIPGSEIFLGRDNDYSKHLTTNIPQYDKMAAHPEYVVMGTDGKLYIDKDNPYQYETKAPLNIPITNESSIRMLTGVEDIDNGDGSYTSGISYFYIKGKTPDGKLINTKFSLSNDDKVSDLLEKIGRIYGNTATSKVVDVSLNDMGEIQIKDMYTGKMVTDFFMVASDKDRNSIDDLVKNGDYIVEFQKSYLPATPTVDTIQANNKYFDNRVFKFGSYFFNYKQRREAIAQDKVFDVLGKEGIDSSGNIVNIDHLTLSGTDVNGNSVNVNLTINSSTTLEDIVNAIKSNFNVDAKIENGEIVIYDNTINNTETSKLSISITAKDINDNNLIYFTPKDSINFDNLWMDKEDNLITGNYSNIENDYKVIFKNGEKIIEKNPNAQNYVNEDSLIIDSISEDTLPKNINIKYRDINGDLKTATITLDDNGSYFTVNGNTYHIYGGEGKISPAHDTITTVTEIDTQTCQLCTTEKFTKGVTFKQLADVVSMLVTNNIPASDSFEDYQNALRNAQTMVESGIDDKGRIYFKDLQNKVTNIDVSITTDDSSLYFQANNALTIDSPEVDFFETLQKAIEAVENGYNYANYNSKDPRNTAIQGAIEAIDHVADRVRRAHAKIGAVSNEFTMTIDRTTVLETNLQVLQSDNIDTDIGEASMRLASLKTSYQALLASIAKVSNLTLLNYLK